MSNVFDSYAFNITLIIISSALLFYGVVKSRKSSSELGQAFVRHNFKPCTRAELFAQSRLMQFQLLPLKFAVIAYRRFVGTYRQYPMLFFALHNVAEGKHAKIQQCCVVKLRNPIPVFCNMQAQADSTFSFRLTKKSNTTVELPHCQEFSQTFKLSGENHNAIRAVLDSSVCDIQLKRPELTLKCTGTALLLRQTISSLMVKTDIDFELKYAAELGSSIDESSHNLPVSIIALAA